MDPRAQLWSARVTRYSVPSPQDRPIRRRLLLARLPAVQADAGDEAVILGSKDLGKPPSGPIIERSSPKQRLDGPALLGA